MSLTASECPECGRRYVPARRFCMACSLVETRSTALRPAGVLLTTSMLHRAGKDIVTTLPSLIGMVRESGGGATFWAPVEENLQLASGTPVAFLKKAWPLPDGGTFEAIVVRPKEAAE